MPIPLPPSIMSVLPMEEKNYITIHCNVIGTINLYFSDSELTLNKLMATKIPNISNVFTHEPLFARTYYYAATVTNGDGESELSPIMSGTPVETTHTNTEYIPFEAESIEIDLSYDEEIVLEVE